MTQGSTEEAKSESISFVIVTENGAALTGTNLEAIGLNPNDEMIVLTRADRTHEVERRGSSVQVVGIADNPSLFALRRHIPAICHNDWIVVLEEHAHVTPEVVDRIRELIRDRPDIDMIPFLAVNLTSLGPWSWAAFLHSLATVWAPLDSPPPFSQVTSVIVRRSKIGSEVLAEGVWEFQTVPEIYSSGQFDYSNQIHINHHKHLTMAGCLEINFCNGWACTYILRTLGMNPKLMRKDARRLVWRRPRELMSSVQERAALLPTGTKRRLQLVGLAHYVGIMIGSVITPGRAMHKFD